MGTPVTLPELVAAMLGTLLTMRAGLLTTLEACVTTDEVEFDRAGDDGRPLMKEASCGGGDGAANELDEFRW